MSVQVSAELLFSRWYESISNTVFLVWSLDLAACAGTLCGDKSCDQGHIVSCLEYEEFTVWCMASSCVSSPGPVGVNLFNAGVPFRSRDSALSIVPILVGTNPANTVIQWLTGLESKIKARGVGSESSRSLSPGARRSCDFTLVAAVGTTGLSLWSDGRPAVCLLRFTFKCRRNPFLTVLDAFGLPVHDQLPQSKKKRCLSGVARGGGTAPTIEEGSNLWPVHFQRYHAGAWQCLCFVRVVLRCVCHARWSSSRKDPMGSPQVQWDHPNGAGQRASYGIPPST